MRRFCEEGLGAEGKYGVFIVEDADGKSLKELKPEIPKEDLDLVYRQFEYVTFVLSKDIEDLQEAKEIEEFLVGLDDDARMSGIYNMVNLKVLERGIIKARLVCKKFCKLPAQFSFLFDVVFVDLRVDTASALGRQYDFVSFVMTTHVLECAINLSDLNSGKWKELEGPLTTIARTKGSVDVYTGSSKEDIEDKNLSKIFRVVRKFE